MRYQQAKSNNRFIPKARDLKFESHLALTGVNTIPAPFRITDLLQFREMLQETAPRARTVQAFCFHLLRAATRNSAILWWRIAAIRMVRQAPKCSRLRVRFLPIRCRECSETSWKESISI